MRSPVLVASAALLLASAAAGRADEVVLDNGRTLVGRVVSEDDRAVKLETDAGTMTFERSRVREIRRKPVPEKARTPDTPGGAQPGARGTGAGAAGAASGDAGGDPCDDRAPYAPPPLPKLLAQIEAIRLATWKEPLPEVFPAPASGRTSWRVERADGTVSTERDSPSGPEGVAKVWYLARVLEPAADGKPGRAEWTPMAWRPIGHIWVDGPPERAAYVDDEQLAGEIVRQLGTKDAKAWRRASAISMEMQRARCVAKEKGTTPELAGKAAELLAAVTAATGDATTASAVARILEIESDAMDAPPDGKVRMAIERRALLRELVKSAK